MTPFGVHTNGLAYWLIDGSLFVICVPGGSFLFLTVHRYFGCLVYWLVWFMFVVPCVLALLILLFFSSAFLVGWSIMLRCGSLRLRVANWCSCCFVYLLYFCSCISLSLCNMIIYVLCFKVVDRFFSFAYSCISMYLL